jgi:membrane-bound inhibitor of C-type lysozyme
MTLYCVGYPPVIKRVFGTDKGCEVCHRVVGVCGSKCAKGGKFWSEGGEAVLYDFRVFLCVRV